VIWHNLVNIDLSVLLCCVWSLLAFDIAVFLNKSRIA